MYSSRSTTINAWLLTGWITCSFGTLNVSWSFNKLILPLFRTLTIIFWWGSSQTRRFFFFLFNCTIVQTLGRIWVLYIFNAFLFHDLILIILRFWMSFMSHIWLNYSFKDVRLTYQSYVLLHIIAHCTLLFLRWFRLWIRTVVGSGINVWRIHILSSIDNWWIGSKVALSFAALILGTWSITYHYSCGLMDLLSIAEVTLTTIIAYETVLIQIYWDYNLHRFDPWRSWVLDQM
jgi:hypothetical protein